MTCHMTARNAASAMLTNAMKAATYTTSDTIFATMRGSDGAIADVLSAIKVSPAARRLDTSGAANAT